MLKGRVFVTGGAGYLGKGILQRAHDDVWPCKFTVFSRDEVKHAKLKQRFPDVVTIRGDVGGDLELLTAAMMGHDTVIHAAATKIIPQAELNPIQTFQDNTLGSLNVAYAACQAGVKDVLLVSTDKACASVNAYGASKFMAERIFQEAQQWGYPTDFHIVRYGNVLDSTASVLILWHKQIQEEGLLRITDPNMTRFWLTVKQAVELVLVALEQEPGTVTIPLLPALRMWDMAHFVFPDAEWEVIGTRPGEKKHEELVTKEEIPFTVYSPIDDFLVLHPSISMPTPESMRYQAGNYTSAKPIRWLECDEFLEMVGWVE